jgi:exodeoxyribonuclease V alpha subunit
MRRACLTLVKHPDIPTVELIEIHRAAAATGIPQVNVAIRRGEVLALTPYIGKANGVSFIDASPDEILKRIYGVSNNLGNEGSSQINGPIKRGPAGVLTINGFFHDILTSGQAQIYGFAEGEPVCPLAGERLRAGPLQWVFGEGGKGDGRLERLFRRGLAGN